MNFRATPRSASPGAGPPGRQPRLTRPGDGVLSIRPFRALWIALSLSSLGDWLSIVALIALAPGLTSGGAVAKSSAVGGVWVVTLLPALLLGPIAGALADRLDRRVTMITGDVIRGLLFVSIPLFPNLTWIYIAKFLAGVASQFWNPACAATMPNLVPKDKLERANQLTQLTTWGTAPLAAGLFSVLALVSEGLSRVTPLFHTNNVDLALYFNAASYFVSALTVYFLRQIGNRQRSGKISVPSTARAIWEGWRFIGKTPVVSGLVIGMLGAFSAAGVVVGLGYSYITETLHGGSAGWGLVFAAIFVGMAVGMAFGTRLLGDFSRRRLFGVTLTAAAVPLALIGLVPNLIFVVFAVILLGVLSGIAYPTGFTIVGLEVDDDTRGRVFAFFQSTIQVILLMVIAIVPFLAAGFTAAIKAITGSADVRIAHVTYASAGQNLVVLLAAALTALVGISSYRRMDDRKGVPLREDLLAAVRGEGFKAVPEAAGVNGHAPVVQHGLFLAFEGGEGAGKTTQARLIAIWLREQGYDVVTTHEPGATKVGMRLRALLLDTAHAGMSAYAEALMYAADRAEHVASVIEPALARGAVVITDRYIDSSLAYQGAGRGLRTPEIARLNSWATGGRMPDLTILLDMPPEAGLGRRTRSADRLEAEPPEFHRRVRAGFLALARAEPSRYLVVDATRPVEEISREVKDRIREILPDPVPHVAEANTGSFPAITDHLPNNVTISITDPVPDHTTDRFTDRW
ncbi:dTMP kinase [Trebonia sp.]|uniref:dTMP kinase n=1 Tax=Trebonia sp. TaxID=2767075 RepID=UPI00262E181D|nr:dTMP kinase [Trebonia sp.]